MVPQNPSTRTELYTELLTEVYTKHCPHPVPSRHLLAILRAAGWLAIVVSPNAVGEYFGRIPTPSGDRDGPYSYPDSSRPCATTHEPIRLTRSPDKPEFLEGC